MMNRIVAVQIKGEGEQWCPVLAYDPSQPAWLVAKVTNRYSRGGGTVTVGSKLEWTSVEAFRTAMLDDWKQDLVHSG